SAYVEWLKMSRLCERDCLFVFSVGGGNLERAISVNLVRAMEFAQSVGASIVGVTGRDGGELKRRADACVGIATVDERFVTSQIERVSDPNDAQHRLLREILLVTEVDSGIEISSMADIPAGTGLGSSGAFTVGALQALRAHRREHPSNLELAELACHVELDRL